MVQVGNASGDSTAMAAIIEKARAEVLAAEKERLRHLASGDYEALLKLYDDEVTYTHMNGEVQTKERYLAHVKGTVARHGGSPFVRTDDLAVRIYGGGAVAVMTGTLNSADPETTNNPYRTTLQVWAKKGERWLIVAIQLTSVDRKD